MSYPQAKVSLRSVPATRKVSLPHPQNQGHIGTLRDTSKTQSVPATNTPPPAQTPLTGTHRDTFYTPTAHSEKTSKNKQLRALTLCRASNYIKSVPKCPCTPSYPQAGTRHG